jgi:8-oxo-dGTP pyrophosphatase MutT (NUDIX family)
MIIGAELPWLDDGEGIVAARPLGKPGRGQRDLGPRNRPIRREAGITVSFGLGGDCAMVDAELIRIAAAVINDAGGRILLVRKAGTSAFMQPGGKFEPGEMALETLARELEEELGLDLEAAPVQFLGLFTAEAANEPGQLVQAALYRVIADGPVRQGAEIAEIAWIDPADCAGLELAPLTRKHVLPLLAA